MSEHTTAKLAQFIVNKTTKVDDETWPTSPSDQEIQCRLKAIGYDVEPLASRKADASKVNAPARRVGLFFNKALAAQKNSDYWRLFDAAIDWAAGDRPRRFTDVFRAEWKEIEERRQRVLDNGSPPTNAP